MTNYELGNDDGQVVIRDVETGDPVPLPLSDALAHRFQGTEQLLKPRYDASTLNTKIEDDTSSGGAVLEVR